MPTNALSGWGRYPIVTAEEDAPESLGRIPSLTGRAYLPRGQGRSYGDAGLPAAGHLAINSYRLDRFLSFNPYSGVMDAEAGVTFQAILRIALPRGFFLPVTPGTMFVSLGGAIASNVHGKNHHHSGSLEHFILELEVATPMGTLICSPAVHPDLFRATVGGYGLTGFITRAKLRLKPVETAQVECLRVRAPGLDSLFALLSKHDADYEYSVAWLDTLARGRSMGRGVLMLGNHALPSKAAGTAGSAGMAAQGGSGAPGTDKAANLAYRDKRRLKVPFTLPGALLNRPFLSAFNEVFYRLSRGGAGGKSREGFEGFFYPLDRIGDWNLLYGRKGFFQYQCMIPDPRGEDGIAAALDFLSGNGLGAFLSVLKRCGDDRVMLPFCKRGYTLALDIPFRGQETLRLLDRLDDLVISFGGRVYLTKDARLRPEAFRAMYPESRAWMETVRRYNPEAKSNSRLAERLELWKT
ncbi:MAG: linked oxidase-like protein [Fibrobacteres bacterium]|nr:linked oxidase-like protein [Fibrobacterota bacterium]